MKRIKLIGHDPNIVGATPVEAHQSRGGAGTGVTSKRDKDGGWHVKQDSRRNLKSAY